MKSYENEIHSLITIRLKVMMDKNPSYSQRAMARDIGISHTTLVRFLLKKKRLTPKLAYQLGRFMKLEDKVLMKIIFGLLEGDGHKVKAKTT